MLEIPHILSDTMQALEFGVRRTGQTTITAITEEEAKKIEIIPGRIYEHVIETQYLPDWLLEPIANAIISIQTYIQGVEITYFHVERGVVIYQFWIPPEKATAKLIWFAWAAIAIVLVIIGVLILRWSFSELVVVGVDIFKLALIGFGVIITIVVGHMILKKTILKKKGIKGD